MSASSAQVQFASEFVLFLVAVAGVVVVFLPGQRESTTTWARAALAVGFSMLAAAGFLHGSLLVGNGRGLAVVLARGLGVAALAAGAAGWGAPVLSRRLLWAGAAAVATAIALYAIELPVPAAVVMAAGAVAMGAALVLASRRSISARIAASAAGTLLMIVLVLSVALSAVLVSTIQRGETDRLEGRAATEAGSAAASFRSRLADAKVVAASLAADARALVPLTRAPPSGALTPQLSQLSSRFLSDVSLAYVAPSGAVQGAVRMDDPLVVALTGSEVVRQAIDAADARGSVQVSAGRAVAVGVQPVLATVDGTPQLLGVAVAASPLDGTYLDLTAQDDANLSLALVARTGLVAERGAQPPLAREQRIDRMVRSALDEDRSPSSTTNGRFVAVAPVRAADDRPILALVASSPTTLVEDTRQSLFRSLFLIALGGTLLALMLASLVGNRIGTGLRRLRAAAEALGQGQLGVRAAVRSSDEVGVLGATFDSMADAVQQKTAAEAQLRARLEAVVAGMGEALVATDGDGRVTDFNRAAEELVGVPAAAARGRPLEEVLRLVDEGGHVLELRSAGPGSEGWRARGSVVRTDGSHVPAVVSAGALGGRGGQPGTVLVLRDLRAEQALDQMKAEFISRAGHELRTPLTSIMGFAEMLAFEDVSPEESRAWRAEILAQSRGLLRIVEMLEFIASTEAGRVTLRPAPVNPRTVVDHVVQRWADQEDGRHQFGRRVSRGTPPVMADQHWLTFCLNELVGNAVKFSPEGGPITVTARPADGIGTEISVSDRGNGMTGEEMAEAFGEFVQCDPSDTRSYGGLGLGLSLVRRVIEAHGGTVHCESTKGKGSRFSMVLPSAPAEQR